MGNATSMFDCAVNPLHPLPSEEVLDAVLAPPEPSSVEAGVPLRDSVLWKLQRQFYERRGGIAWKEGIVPNFVTSNSFIARAYARVIIGALHDAASKKIAGEETGEGKDVMGGEGNSNNILTSPLTIVEVGAGHGKLAFLIVSYLLQYRPFLPKLSFPVTTTTTGTTTTTTSSPPSPPYADLPFRYVITDSSMECINAIRTHPSLQEWFQAGILDVALWDAEQVVVIDEHLTQKVGGVKGDAPSPTSAVPFSLQLLVSGETLTRERFLLPRKDTNISTVTAPSPPPLLVVANYTADSLKMDAFRIQPKPATTTTTTNPTPEGNGESTITTTSTATTTTTKITTATAVIEQALVTLISSRAEPDQSDADILQRLQVSWTYAPIGAYTTTTTISTTTTAVAVISTSNSVASDGAAATTATPIPTSSSSGSLSLALPPLYKQNPILGDILTSYASSPRLQTAGGIVLIPLGAINMLSQILQLSCGRAIVLIGDKGFNYASELCDPLPASSSSSSSNHLGSSSGIARDPHVAMHGSFSLMVNFHALRVWARAHGGSTLSTPHTDGLKVTAFFFDEKNHQGGGKEEISVSSALHPTSNGVISSSYVSTAASSKQFNSLLPSTPVEDVDLLQRISTALISSGATSSSVLTMAPAGCLLPRHGLTAFMPWSTSSSSSSTTSATVTAPLPPKLPRNLPTYSSHKSNDANNNNNNNIHHDSDEENDDDDADVDADALRDRSNFPYLQAQLAAVEAFHGFTPEDFAFLQRSLREEILVPASNTAAEAAAAPPSLRHALALLRLSHHDADVFLKFRSTFIDKLSSSQTSETTQRDARFDMDRVYSSYFPLQPSKDVCFELGRVCMGLRDYSAAVSFFAKSNETCGDHHVTWHNMGVCYFYAGDSNSSIACLRHALVLNPEYEDARLWMGKVVSRGNSNNNSNNSNNNNEGFLQQQQSNNVLIENNYDYSKSFDDKNGADDDEDNNDDVPDGGLDDDEEEED